MPFDVIGLNWFICSRVLQTTYMLELFVKQLLCSTDAGIGEPFIFVKFKFVFR